VPNNFTLEISVHPAAWGQEHTQDIPTRGCTEDSGDPNVCQSRFPLGTAQLLHLANGCKAELRDKMQKARVPQHHYPAHPYAVRHES
jgi:hypothetical protein